MVRYADSEKKTEREKEKRDDVDKLMGKNTFQDNMRKNYSHDHNNSWKKTTT